MPGIACSKQKKFIRTNIAMYTVLMLSSIIIAIVISVIQPEAFRRIIQSLSENHSNQLKHLVIFFGGVIIFQVLFKSLRSVIVFALQKKMQFQIENDFLDHYANLEFWNYSTTSANVLALFRQNITDISKSFNEYFVKIVQFGMIMVLTSIYTATINWMVLFVCLLLTGVMILISQKGISQIPVMSQQLTTDRNRLHAIQWEHINNTEVVSFLNVERTVNGYVEANEAYLANWLALKKINNRYQLFSQFGSKFLILLIMLLCGVVSIFLDIGLADIYALVLVIPQLSNSLFEIPSTISEYKQLHGKLSAMDTFYDLKRENIDKTKDSCITEDLETLIINNVSFKYLDQEKSVLNHITLRFDRELVCLAGHSGCGKSTLLKICGRLLPAQEGYILWNNLKIEDISRSLLWNHIGYLDQTPRVIPGTLLMNITLGKNVHDREARLQKAISDADLDSFIINNPKGLEMDIDPSQISSGELQKICFARLFYMNYTLLLLDEATSAMDPSSEKYIIQALKRRIKEEHIIVIAVAHKLNFQKYADQLVLIKNGEIEAVGKYEELLHTSTYYKTLEQ